MTPEHEALVEQVDEFLHELDGWERAYPLSAFPEPDLKRAAELLKAGGMTLDAVSASNMRHVVSRLAPKMRALIPLIRNAALDEAGRWQPIETAPKDRTVLWGWMKSRGGSQPYMDFLEWFETPHGGGWWVSRCLPVKPTHWMPLPQSPLNQSSGDGIDK